MKKFAREPARKQGLERLRAKIEARPPRGLGSNIPGVHVSGFPVDRGLLEAEISKILKDPLRQSNIAGVRQSLLGKKSDKALKAAFADLGIRLR